MKTNEIKNPSNSNEIEKQDAQLDEAALDGVVGGARPSNETHTKTSDVTKCCW